MATSTIHVNDTIASGIQPAHEIPTDDGAPPTEERGLCLSGGGYRAMLFHLGALIRLNETGLLAGMDRISSVSGGSITAATLGLHWEKLDWRDGIATDLEECVVEPVRALARHTIDMSSVIEGMAPFTSVGKRVAHSYREHLFGDAELRDLPGPGGPLFVICATNMESGALFRFSRPHVADWRVGMIEEPRVSLADAVAASSAFPPVLSPFDIDLRDACWESQKGNDLAVDEFRDTISLSDGGVYDNLGLETVWKRCRNVLVSDGGGHIPDDPDPPHDWPRHMLRVLHVIDNQVRSLRKRQTIASYRLGLRGGTYWSVRSDIDDYGLSDALRCPQPLTELLAATPTRLKKLPDTTQERLINWGYAITDAGLRRWVAPTLPAPTGFPYPESGIG